VGLSPTLLLLLIYKLGARDGAQTHDPNLGKVVLYQLSYSRNQEEIIYVILTTAFTTWLSPEIITCRGSRIRTLRRAFARLFHIEVTNLYSLLFFERMTGVEPTTLALEGRRSSQLSYIRIFIWRVITTLCLDNCRNSPFSRQIGELSRH
jgi:hypothetical protein